MSKRGSHDDVARPRCSDPTHHATQGQNHHDGVVDVAEDGNEVGDEINGQKDRLAIRLYESMGGKQLGTIEHDAGTGSVHPAVVYVAPSDLQRS
jgi:hypothetical protein